MSMGEGIPQQNELNCYVYNVNRDLEKTSWSGTQRGSQRLLLAGKQTKARHQQQAPA